MGGRLDQGAGRQQREDGMRSRVPRGRKRPEPLQPTQAVEARTYDPTTTIRVRPLSVSLTEPNELTAHPRQTQETYRAGRSTASIAHPSQPVRVARPV